MLKSSDILAEQNKLLRVYTLANLMFFALQILSFCLSFDYKFTEVMRFQDVQPLSSGFRFQVYGWAVCFTL